MAELPNTSVFQRYYSPRARRTLGVIKANVMSEYALYCVYATSVLHQPRPQHPASSPPPLYAVQIHTASSVLSRRCAQVIRDHGATLKGC